MYCQLCRKKIGLLRRVFDPKYCSSDHRKKARKASARLVREYDPGLYYEDPWPLFSPDSEKKKAKMSMSGMVISTCLILTLCAAILLVPSSPGGGPAPGVESAGGTLPASGGSTPPRQGGFGETLRRILPERESVSLRENFDAVSSNWVGSSDRWNVDSGFVRPTGLRLLKPTLGLSDYQFEFEGQVEKKGLNWAFRASDSQNYYGTKISISRPGPLPAADLIRYALVDGHELGRSSYPLPLQLRKDQLFRVSVNVKGSDFVTSINGQIVDTWSDNRLKKGGVGFFSERGELAAIHWVNISQKRSIIDGLFAAVIPSTVFDDLD